MFGRIIDVFVHTQNDCQILTLGWSGNNHFFCAAFEMGCRFGRVGEETGRLDDDFCSQICPGNLSGITLRDYLDFVTVDNQ